MLLRTHKLWVMVNTQNFLALTACMSHCKQNPSSIQVVSLQDSIQCWDLRRVGQEGKEENDSEMSIAISVFLFWEGTGLFCNNCQRVRGYCNFWRVMLGIDMHVLLTLMSSYLSLFLPGRSLAFLRPRIQMHTCVPQTAILLSLAL